MKKLPSIIDTSKISLYQTWKEKNILTIALQNLPKEALKSIQKRAKGEGLNAEEIYGKCGFELFELTTFIDQEAKKAGLI